MGRELLQAAPVFNDSIRSSAEILAPYYLDLLQCFQAPSGWDDPVASAVGLTAIQVSIRFSSSTVSYHNQN
jgi:hypothetical protein